jgi:hypothetical protein
MTIAELIEKLKSYPQDMAVGVYCHEYGFSRCDFVEVDTDTGKFLDLVGLESRELSEDDDGEV